MTSRSGHERPLISWLILTTLKRHRWWERLVEYLKDDSLPAELTECVILGTQDHNFAGQARLIGQCVAKSIPFQDDVMKRWNRVRFVENYSPEFNVAAGRNILLSHARGDVLLYPDADVQLLRHSFSAFAISALVRSRLGLLSFPSLNNGRPFKPETGLPWMPHPSCPNITLVASANGMVVAQLASIAQLMGGQNPAHARWGVYTALSTRLAQAGFLSGYTNPDQFWLATDDGQSPLSLTDNKRNPDAQFQRCVGVAMLNDYYSVTLGDPFWTAQRTRYNVRDERREPELMREVARRMPTFEQHQALTGGLLQYPFKPWSCLDHEATPDFVNGAWSRAESFFLPLEQRLKSLGLETLL